MAQLIRDIMTSDPVLLDGEATLMQAAQAMRDEDIGNVVVTRNERPRGILTDRDLVVRGIAADRDPHSARVSALATDDPVTVAPGETAEQAAATMREHAVRRLPVCEESGEIVGVVAIGDLAVHRDPTSALADISQDEPDR